MLLIAAIAAHMILNMIEAIPAVQSGKPFPAEPSFELMTRSQWHARPPVETTPLDVPVPYVVIHHTYIPPTCENKEECAYAMRTMQSMHIDQNKWWDIGYNFCVGSDGVVYEGRGWTTLGAHSKHFNTVSIGICLIGNWNDTLPPKKQLDAVHQLIEYGSTHEYIKPDYKLVGHRQVRDTECPGQALYEHIQTWANYDPKMNLNTMLEYVKKVNKDKSIEINNIAT